MTTAIDREISRLGWTVTDDEPTLINVYDDADLPYRWVRLSDDQVTLAIGDADEISAALAEIETDEEYGSGLSAFEDREPSSKEWPTELIAVEQLDPELTPNDNPDCVLTLSTNGGIQIGRASCRERVSPRV